MTALPKKKEGDQLGAEHVNELSRAAEMFLNQGASNPRAFPMRQVEVTETDYDGDTDLYTCVPRYYDGDGWVIDDETVIGYPFDPSADENVSYSVGDKVAAYFDDQRSAYIPIKSGGGTGASASVSHCGCEVVTNPDIEINGKKATYTVAIPLGRIVEFQECGILVLKGATYTLNNTGTRSTPTEIWAYTVAASDFDVFNYAGNAATTDDPIEGTITWNPFFDPKAKVIIDVAAVISSP